MAKKKTKVQQRTPAPRFGIGEWYGQSFVRLSHEERKRLADAAIIQTPRNAPVCPFKPNGKLCHKKGGVCSLRLYNANKRVDEKHWTAAKAEGNAGDLRITCPARFVQDGIIYRSIGLTILNTNAPQVATEVRFLQREQAEPAVASAAPVEPMVGLEEDEEEREDVGNIDMVLVAPKPQLPENIPLETVPMKWAALEIQAVYFSGPKMSSLITHIRDFPTADLPFPDTVRRPDYRSSGPKRLMPQLQIKVPTLRRWGKKMAVVVDEAFYRNMGRMETVGDISNCDIAWFLVRFDETQDPVRLIVGEPKKQTLERAVEGLTGGVPVTLADFESKISEKLARPV